MKKYLSPLAFALMAFGFASCNLTTLEELGPDGIPIDVFQPNSIPPSLGEFETQFHGGEQLAWSAVAFTLAGFDGLQDCRLDDIIVVKADGTYQYDSGGTLCGAEDSELTRSGTWRIIGNGSNIIFDEGTNREYTAIVNGLEDSTISLSGEYLGLEIKGIYTSK